MNSVDKAKWFAAYHHSINDQRYGRYPYIHHLADVYNILIDFEVNHYDLQIAAWLHDILEDTGVERKDIVFEFGKSIDKLVWAVTGTGTNRKARNKSIYKKINEFGYGATILKLADRLANVQEALDRMDQDHFEMYQKEYPEFKKALFNKSTDDSCLVRMWAGLDEIMK